MSRPTRNIRIPGYVYVSLYRPPTTTILTDTVVKYKMCQLGNDVHATKFIESRAFDPELSDVLDCTGGWYHPFHL